MYIGGTDKGKISAVAKYGRDGDKDIADRAGKGI